MLTAIGQDLFYWKSSKAEIDFLYDEGKFVYPFEIKAGLNPKSQSLSSYNKKYSPILELRSTLLNLKKDGKILNIPLYAITRIEKYLELVRPPAG